MSRPRLDLNTVHNARARAQRLSDAKFFNCTIRSSNENSIEVAFIGPAQVEPGDAMRFEIFGHQGVVSLTAVVHAALEFTYRFALVGPPAIRNATESVRLLVNEMSAECSWEGGFENAEIIDIAPRGIGIRVSEKIDPGTVMKVSIILPNANFEAIGVCRYCRAVEDSAHYRAGIHFSEMNRLSEARWMQQFEALDAAA